MRRTLISRQILLILVPFVAGCCDVAQRKDQVARIELLALLQTLNADLLSHDSATLTLERWCADHHLAEPARITAQRLRDGVKPIPGELRVQLAIETAEPVAYRHVQLVCGDHVLSEADNWYVPSRLTAAMNERLENSDEPFGKVVKALGFQRHTLSAGLLWSPLPPLWEMRGSQALAPLRMPQFVLRHVAVLNTSAQIPFSVVMEKYTNELLAFRSWDAASSDPVRGASDAKPALQAAR